MAERLEQVESSNCHLGVKIPTNSEFQLDILAFMRAWKNFIEDPFDDTVGALKLGIR